MLVVGLIIAFGFFIIGVPIAVSFGLGAALVLIYHNGLPFSSIASMMFGGLDHFTWVAVPLFIFAGNLMIRSNSAKALLDFVQAMLGHITGGIAASAVLACVFFAALTGSGAATIASIGTLMIPKMRETGYSDGFATGLVSVTGTLGNLIPPSLFFIIYGMLIEDSIAKLFLAGLLPGLLIALMLMITAFIICKYQKVGTLARENWKVRGKTFVYALPALSIPVLILGGIYAGIFTPTEAATIACVVAIVAGFWYKGMSWESFKKASLDTLRVTSMLLFLICTATLLGKVLVLSGFPQTLTNIVVEWGLSPTSFVIGFSVVLLILGTFMEGTPMLYVTLPIVMPCAAALNVNLFHLGVVYCVAILIGQITPPVGIMLYVGSSIAKVPPEVVIRGAIPFLITMTIALVLICIFPGISLYLPSLMK
ncbi:MAG: Sialic acid TRAP transporter permease protein SiaT [Smithella sp. PtaU1.Bin162]|nr:MAG: Sialic acid TRAP transporter permease protein SiaT [Smithella sp. PtaU1.Bin162]